MTTHSPFFSLTLLNLAIAVGKLAKEADGDESQQTMMQAFTVALQVFEKEAPLWDSAYAAEVVKRWEEKYVAWKYNNVLDLVKNSAGLTMREAVPLLFLESKAWAWAPDAEKPSGMSASGAPYHSYQATQRLDEAVSAGHTALIRRLLDWPDAVSHYMKAQRFQETGISMAGMPGFIKGRTGWAWHLRNSPTASIETLLDLGMDPHTRDALGRPCMAYATKNDTVSLLLKKGWDPLGRHNPVEQRIKDARILLDGWAFYLERHLTSGKGEDRRDNFSAAFDYITERLAQWPVEERQTMLLPWLADHAVSVAMDIQGRNSPLSTLLRDLASIQDMNHPHLVNQSIQEGDTAWTFEQWCAVRFLRGHTANVALSKPPQEHALAKFFSAGNSPAFEQTTEDLHRLVDWQYSRNGLDYDPGLIVPTERLIPLLTRIFSGDAEGAQDNRNRLHHLMRALLEDLKPSDDHGVRDLLIAYTEWTWRAGVHGDIASRQTIHYLDKYRNTLGLSPEDTHFLVLNHMVTTIPLPSPLEHAAWAMLETSMNQQGHTNDQRTSSLLQEDANRTIRWGERYRLLEKSARLNQALPEPQELVKKPRF